MKQGWAGGDAIDAGDSVQVSLGKVVEQQSGRANDKPKGPVVEKLFQEKKNETHNEQPLHKTIDGEMYSQERCRFWFNRKMKGIFI